MNEVWDFWESAAGEPALNMAIDEALLETATERGNPILRFYGWSMPSATFGYSQSYERVAALTLLRPLIRRPTGGGLVPHNSDWTYSVVFPPRHSWYALKATASYERVHGWIKASFGKLDITTELAMAPVADAPGQCFIGAEKSDVLWHGRKIAGAAQRRTRCGLLIQGSVQPPPLPLDPAEWRQAMLKVAVENWNVRWRASKMSEDFAAFADQIALQKYRKIDFNQKR